MAALDFPNSPTVGMTMTAGSSTWTWDGAKWLVASMAAGGSASVPISGGSMTGPLILNADPTNALGAATKQYTDNKAATAAPPMDGTAAVGVSALFARSDHVHASDTAKLSLTGGTLTGALTPSQTAGIVGTTTNNSAVAGAVGEVISANVASASQITLSGTGVVTNIASISLTAGDWDVQGEVWIAVGTGGATAVRAGLSTTSATLPADSSISQSAWNINSNPTLLASSGSGYRAPLRPCRALLSATTPYYLVTSVDYPSGTITVFGSIWARRAR
jgi:hypothetical protein